MRPRSFAAPAAVGWIGAWLFITSPALAVNRFFIPEVSLPEGGTSQTLFIHCEHDVTLRAYSLSIQYDPAVLRVTSITHEGTSVENPDFWGDASRGGEIALGTVIDTTPPLTRFLAPASDHTLTRITVDVLGKAGTTASLVFKDGLGRGHPVVNDLTDQTGRSADLKLENGTIRIVPPAVAPSPVANAGPDQVVPEVSRVTLDATRSLSRDGKPLSFIWTQTGGPPVQEVSGADTVRVTFTVPPVGGDTEIVFRVDVRADAAGGASDSTSVFAVDVDQRRGQIGSVADEAQLIDGGRRAIVFQADLVWDSALEDAFWTRARFTASGAGDESQLTESVSLYFDSNGNGSFDDDDEQLGATDRVAEDGDAVDFSFGERLGDGDARRLFLVTELQEPRVLGILLPMAAIFAAGLGLGRIRRGSARRRGLGSVLLAALLAGMALGSISCGGGGGGGGGRPAARREVRFDIISPSDIDLQGAKTGVTVKLAGVPVQGPSLEA